MIALSLWITNQYQANDAYNELLGLEDCVKFKLILSKLELFRKFYFCEALFPSVVAELRIVLAALQNQTGQCGGDGAVREDLY